MTLWRLEGAHLPSQTQGQIVPEYYGGLHKDIPGYPLQVGYSAPLADNCGADLTQTVLKLSGPDLDEIRDALAPGMPVVAQLETEWVYVTAFLESPWRITVTRAYSGTAAAAHPKGTEVYFIESRAVYVFASAPPGCRYPGNAVVQVRLNDVAQTPPCTIRLQDDRWVPGARFVTAEFDLTRAFGGVSPPPALRRIVLETPRPADAMGGRVAVAPEATRADLMRAAVRYRAGAGPGAGFRRLDRGGPAVDPAPPAAPPPVHSEGRGGRGPDILGPATSAPIRTRAAPLGDCTMDLRGLVDTPAGHYTGTPSAALDEPTAITACLLDATYGESRRHLPTWATTRGHHQTLNLRWQVVWRGEPFETFRERAGFNGLADLWLDEDGLWHYTMHHTAAPVTTVTPREILGEVAVGFLAPSATHLAVTWGEGLTRGTFTLDTPPMIARYGRIQDRALGLPWIANEVIARTVASQWLPKWDRDRWTATMAVAPSLAALTRTDRVLIDTPILNPYGLVWEIRGTTDRGDQRVLTLIEGDATGETLPGFLGGMIRATARATGTVGVLVSMLAGAGTGKAIATGALTTIGAAVLAGAMLATTTAAGALTTATAAALAGAMAATAIMSGNLVGGVTLDATSGTTASNANATWSHTVSGTDRLLLVGVALEMDAPSHTVSGVTYDGVALTVVTALHYTTSSARGEIWRLIAPNIGTHNIVVTFTSITGDLQAALGAVSVTGVHQTTPLGTPASNTGNTANASITVNAEATDLVFGHLAVNTGPTVTDGQTTQWNRVNGTQTRSVGSTKAGAAPTTTLNWTHVAVERVVIGVAIKASV
jgi:hypothetical protein